jgi:hypothetical protein
MEPIQTTLNIEYRHKVFIKISVESFSSQCAQNHFGVSKRLNFSASMAMDCTQGIKIIENENTKTVQALLLEKETEALKN